MTQHKFHSKRVHQRPSTKLRGVDAASEQLSIFADASTPTTTPVDIDYLLTLPNLRRALRYSMSLANLERKEVYSQLGKDKSTWTRIEDGDVPFPADLIPQLKLITRNDAVLLWLNHHCGFDIRSMRMLQDDKDRVIDDLRAENERLQTERATERRLFKELLKPSS